MKSFIFHGELRNVTGDFRRATKTTFKYETIFSKGMIILYFSEFFAIFFLRGKKTLENLEVLSGQDTNAPTKIETEKKADRKEKQIERQ